jgi:bacterioferritin
MADKKLIELMNKALSMEYQAIIQYQTQAELIAAEDYEPIKARLLEVAGDEEKHAKMLRERISMLGGTPGTIPAKVGLSDDIPAVLKMDVQAEKDAVAIYRQILPMCVGNEILHHAIRHILMEEQEHTEEFSQLLGIKGEIKYE